MQPLFIVYKPTRNIASSYAQYLSRQGSISQPPTLREIQLLELLVRYYQQHQQRIPRMWHSVCLKMKDLTSWLYRGLGFEELDRMIIEHLVTGKYSPTFLQNTWVGFALTYFVLETLKTPAGDWFVELLKAATPHLGVPAFNNLNHTVKVFGDRP